VHERRRPHARQLPATSRTVHTRTTLPIDAHALRIVAVADTHGHPHDLLGARIDDLAPAHILHAGDVGDLAVLRELEKHAPVTAVRGNIDGHELPDVVTVELCRDGRAWAAILMTHIAVFGPKLRADIARLAHAQGASLVVCGHSHVPFAAHQQGITVFNPGSVGPRRFRLPIAFGVIDVDTHGVAVRHIDCETGLPWKP
jgi:putative phosphoesterase